MATEMQKRALDAMVEKGRKGKRISVSAIMRDVGYSEVTATHPDKLTKAMGFIELAESLGLTDSFLTRALVNDIKKKPGKRTKELELGFKVRGRLKDVAPTTVFNTLNVYTTDQERRIAERILNQQQGEQIPSGLPNSDQPAV